MKNGGPFKKLCPAYSNVSYKKFKRVQLIEDTQVKQYDAHSEIVGKRCTVYLTFVFKPFCENGFELQNVCRHI